MKGTQPSFDPRGRRLLCPTDLNTEASKTTNLTALGKSKVLVLSIWCHFITPNGSLHKSPQLGFVDDLVSSSSSLAGPQQQADLISVFALVFVLQISATKLRTFKLSSTPSPLAPNVIRPISLSTVRTGSRATLSSRRTGQLQVPRGLVRLQS